MQEKKKDRRVKYTMMVIKNSFVKILKQKPISKITIKEICEDADINRATFYAHYSDQYDLLHQIENNLIDDINRYLNSYGIENKWEVPIEMLEKILEYIKENSELFDMLLNSNGDIQFQQEITKVIGNQQLLPTNVSNSLSKADAEYIFLFFANGCIGVIKKWLKDGMKKPIKEMAELMLRVVINGREAFV
ncbi:MAG: TetR-like C-terminal domain-containing protein [Clostridiales bacterium]|nr:TetR-like C-terminal domain-containing protein [Clostridiales bacterium]HBM80736.1 TetR/AcrR family transcriptional regulator [Clostridiaceae bacterium]